MHNNRIEQIFEGEYYLNNVMELKISENNIESYVSLMNLVQNLESLVEIEYYGNRFLYDCGQNIQEFMICLIKSKYCQRLRKVNQKELEKQVLDKKHSLKMEQMKQFMKYVRNSKQKMKVDGQIQMIYKLNNQLNQYLQHVNQKVIGKLFDFRHKPSIQQYLLFDSYKVQE